MIISDMLLILTTIAGAATAIVTFYKAVIRPILKAFKKIKETVTLIEKLHDEFKPNGGSSLRDAVNRIEEKILCEQGARRVLSMALDVGVFECDADGLCLWVNQYYTTITGLSPFEARNFGWINAVDIRDRDGVVEQWDLAIKHKRIFQMEYKLVNILNGIPTKVRCHSSPIFNDKNEIIGHVGIITPI